MTHDEKHIQEIERKMRLAFDVARAQGQTVVEKNPEDPFFVESERKFQANKHKVKRSGKVKQSSSTLVELTAPLLELPANSRIVVHDYRPHDSQDILLSPLHTAKGSLNERCQKSGLYKAALQSLGAQDTDPKFVCTKQEPRTRIPRR